MFNNHFFRMLFDYRGAITRRQYWGSLLFLLILLTLGNLPSRWDQLLFEMDLMSNIQDTVTYSFLLNFFNSLITILHFSAIVVAFSLIIVTLKRSRTLGYSKITGWFFAILTYLSVFSIRGLIYYFEYYNRILDAHRQSLVDNEDSRFIFFAVIAFVVLIAIFATIVVIFLSKQSNSDYEEEPVYRYDSISSIFSLAKFSLIYVILLLFMKEIVLKSQINQSLIYLIIALFLVCSIIFYLRIFIRRSQDAKVSSMYVIIGFFLIIGLIVTYFILTGIRVFGDNFLLHYSLSRLCLLFVYAYLIYTYILIALPSRD